MTRLRVLLAIVCGYLAGVGVSFAFGLDDPWAYGLLGIGLGLGGAAGGALRRTPKP
ncbi:hypothetical protein ACIOD2_25125 [Amycolatopsis sp. NPDC088138]|uniref:hypothetical protein n=1 Tax=Amycolatopsis sp. NPDC088138 TaxID=3363938 RepID=UPI003827B74D